MRQLGTAEIRLLLLTRDDLLMAGWTRSGIDAGIASGALRRLRRGCYMRGADWGDLWPESQLRAHVLAAHAEAATAPVFALTAAAVLLDLPLYRVRVDRVHTVHPHAARSTNRMVRHREALPPQDVVEIDGMLCTAPDRTVLDLARRAGPEVAIACADAWLARVAGPPRRYDEAAAERWRAAMDARQAEPGPRGIRVARRLVAIADGRSELPLESVTKLQLHRLGFRPRLQVPVRGPGARTYWMDLELPEVNTFLECDGRAKYLDPDMRAHRTADEVVLAEKSREDWVRSTTGHRVLRVTSADAATPASLAALLTRSGIPLPDRRSRMLLPNRPLIAGQ